MPSRRGLHMHFRLWSSAVRMHVQRAERPMALPVHAPGPETKQHQAAEVTCQITFHPPLSRALSESTFLPTSRISCLAKARQIYQVVNASSHHPPSSFARRANLLVVAARGSLSLVLTCIYPGKRRSRAQLH